MTYCSGEWIGVNEESILKDLSVTWYKDHGELNKGQVGTEKSVWI